MDRKTAMDKYADAKARLAKIAEIIEQVDSRAMASDGPVTPTLEEMKQSEISEIYRLALCKGKVPAAS